MMTLGGTGIPGAIGQQIVQLPRIPPLRSLPLPLGPHLLRSPLAHFLCTTNVEAGTGLDAPAVPQRRRARAQMVCELLRTFIKAGRILNFAKNGTTNASRRHQGWSQSRPRSSVNRPTKLRGGITLYAQLGVIHMRVSRLRYLIE